LTKISLITTVHSLIFRVGEEFSFLSKSHQVFNVSLNTKISETVLLTSLIIILSHVGFWASELIHPYDVFTKAGWQVVIASPQGGKVEFDNFSDPRDPSGYSKDDTLSMEYIQQPQFMKLLENTAAIASLNPDDFDAIVVCGGQSPMLKR
jgi:putative intracellular protease/amidase